MGPFFFAIGLAAWAVKAFGEKELVKRHGDRLLIVGFLLITIGLGLMSMGSSGCGTSWSTHGSESDC